MAKGDYICIDLHLGYSIIAHEINLQKAKGKHTLAN